MRTIIRDIVGAFIFSADDQILLGKTANGGVYPGVWVVAGGGIEPGESEEQALRREVLEELALDIRPAKVEKIKTPSRGESKKTLRDTGEEVFVEMTFLDYTVRFDRSAADIQFVAQDDLFEAQWFPLIELKRLALSPGTAATLTKLGYKV